MMEKMTETLLGDFDPEKFLDMTIAMLAEKPISKTLDIDIFLTEEKRLAIVIGKHHCETKEKEQPQPSPEDAKE